MSTTEVRNPDPHGDLASRQGGRELLQDEDEELESLQLCRPARLVLMTFRRQARGVLSKSAAWYRHWI